MEWLGACDAGRPIEVRVKDSVLQRLGPSTGADHTSVLETQRCKIFKIAADKYERGCIEPDDIILVTDSDIA